MAKIKNIVVSYGVTKNMGNYESLRLSESVEAELQDGESCTDAIDECRKYLVQKVEADVKILKDELP